MESEDSGTSYPLDYFLVSSGQIRRNFSLSQSQELRAGKLRFESKALSDDVKQYCIKKAQKEDLSAMGPDFDPELLTLKPPAIKDGSKVLIFGCGKSEVVWVSDNGERFVARIAMKVKDRWSGRVSTRIVDSLLNRNHFGISWGPAPRDQKLTKAQIQKIKRKNVQDNEQIHIQKITNALYTTKTYEPKQSKADPDDPEGLRWQKTPEQKEALLNLKRRLMPDDYNDNSIFTLTNPPPQYRYEVVEREYETSYDSMCITGSHEKTRSRKVVIEPREKRFTFWTHPRPPGPTYMPPKIDEPAVSKVEAQQSAAPAEPVPQPAASWAVEVPDDCPILIPGKAKKEKKPKVVEPEGPSLSEEFGGIERDLYSVSIPLHPQEEPVYDLTEKQFPFFSAKDLYEDTFYQDESQWLNPSEFVEYYVNYIYGDYGDDEYETGSEEYESGSYEESEEVDPYDYETPVPLQIDPPENPPEMYLSELPDVQCPSAEIAIPTIDHSSSAQFFFDLKEAPSPSSQEFILQPTSSQDLDNYFSVESLGGSKDLQFDDSCLCSPSDDIYFQIPSAEEQTQNQPQVEILLNAQQEGFFIDEISSVREDQFVDVNQFDISSKLLSSVTIDARPATPVIFVE